MRTALRYGLEALLIEGPVIWLVASVYLGMLNDKTIVMLTARDLGKMPEPEASELQQALDTLGVEYWDEISYHPDLPVDVFVHWGELGERPLPELTHFANLPQLAERN